MKRILSAAIAILMSLAALAQNGGTASFDKLVHDFGDIALSDGPVSCTFTVTNNSDKPVSILSAVASCGCTNVKWTREALAPGKSGKIDITYSNEDGAFPFDKTVTVYLTEAKKPTVLHIRGIVHEKAKPLSETFPVHYGSLALRSAEIKGGNFSQGEQKSGEFKVANIGTKPITVTFKDVSEGLSIKGPVTIKPQQTADIQFTLTASRERWGKNWYYATPLVNGSAQKSRGKVDEGKLTAGMEALRSDPNPKIAEGSQVIGIWGITKENFTGMNKQQKANGPKPACKESSFTFGKISAGKKIQASFEIENEGKEELLIYKADTESARVVAPTTFSPVKVGGKTRLQFTLDTKGLPAGEQLFVITLYTNSPSRPIFNLYITGFVL